MESMERPRPELDLPETALFFLCALCISAVAGLFFGDIGSYAGFLAAFGLLNYFDRR
ncbi:MAG: hypothetical protein AAF690_14465 [Acidobacteriota bacterium]